MEDGGVKTEESGCRRLFVLFVVVVVVFFAAGTLSSWRCIGRDSSSGESNAATGDGAFAGDWRGGVLILEPNLVLLLFLLSFFLFFSSFPSFLPFFLPPFGALGDTPLRRAENYFSSWSARMKDEDEAGISLTQQENTR